MKGTPGRPFPKPGAPAPVWPGRAGPRPSGRAPGHCLSAGVPFGWPSPAHFSQALATTSPRVLSPRTGSSRGWVSVGTQSSAPAPAAHRPAWGGAHPDTPDGAPREAGNFCLLAAEACSLCRPPRAGWLPAVGPGEVGRPASWGGDGVVVWLPEAGVAPAPFSRSRDSGGRLAWPPAKTWS